MPALTSGPPGHFLPTSQGLGPDYLSAFSRTREPADGRARLNEDRRANCLLSAGVSHMNAWQATAVTAHHKRILRNGIMVEDDGAQECCDNHLAFGCDGHDKSLTASPVRS